MITETVLESFELPSLTLEVEETDPLTGTVTIKNNKLTSGTKVYVGFFIGSYDSGSDMFYPVYFVAGDITYYWCTYKEESVPDKGGTKDIELKTYAPSIGEKTTHDIYVWVGQTGTLYKYNTDYGSSIRMVATKKSDWDSYVSKVYDTEIYLDQLTTKPPAPSAEIIDFSISKV